MILYAILTAFVVTGSTLPLDTSLMLSLGAERRPWFSPLMYLASLIGGGAVAIPAALGFVWLLWRGRRREDARAYAIIALSGWALYGLAKLSIARARPHVIPYLYHGAGWYSYPSGHSTLAPIVFGLAAVLWSASWPSSARRGALIAGASALAVTIAFSRVYIGVHYPSDVAGGLLLGIAWSAFWYWWWGTSLGVPREA
ncbi:MAG TPA: phosphatase PAP2 family protein [Gemmatimonadales bacterium]|jgi:undecaprenyl-diphosphatase